jgi:LacI family transcriptional regulator
MKDVAIDAGVSIGAVSKVLRDAYGVSDQMRARVQRSIDKLGYRPDVGARALRGSSLTVGVMLPELSSFYVSEVTEALAQELKETPYSVVVIPAGYDLAGQTEAVESLLDRRIDGLVVIAPWVAADWLENVARRTPTVAVGMHRAGNGFDTVVDDDRLGARLVVDHLVGLGHTRIVHTSENPGSDIGHPLSHSVRRLGYEEAMRAHGLEPEVLVTGYTSQGGVQAVQQLLASAERPTALFAGADVAAIGAMQALDEAGVRIPDDMSLAGYDNIRFSQMNRISLTTVDQSSTLTGSVTAKLLLERMQGGRTQGVQYSVTPRLVIRETTGPIRPA